MVNSLNLFKTNSRHLAITKAMDRLSKNARDKEWLITDMKLAD